MIDVNLPAPTPRIGARVRWYSSAGTYFGHVVSIDEQAGLLTIRIEESDSEVRLPAFVVTLLSAPRKKLHDD